MNVCLLEREQTRTPLIVMFQPMCERTRGSDLSAKLESVHASSLRGEAMSSHGVVALSSSRQSRVRAKAVESLCQVIRTSGPEAVKLLEFCRDTKGHWRHDLSNHALRGALLAGHDPSCLSQNSNFRNPIDRSLPCHAQGRYRRSLAAFRSWRRSDSTAISAPVRLEFFGCERSPHDRRRNRAAGPAMLGDTPDVDSAAVCPSQ